MAADRDALAAQYQASIFALKAAAAGYGAEAESYRQQVIINRTIPEPIPWHLYLIPPGPVYDQPGYQFGANPGFNNCGARSWGGMGR